MDGRADGAAGFRIATRCAVCCIARSATSDATSYGARVATAATNEARVRSTLSTYAIVSRYGGTPWKRATAYGPALYDASARRILVSGSLVR